MKVLKWVEQAVKEIAPECELRLVTLMTKADLAARGLDADRWKISSVPRGEMLGEVARCTVGIIALDPDPTDRAVKVAFPTKTREYLSVGRPVLCVAPPDGAIAQAAAQGGWGMVATDQESTREAVRRIVRGPREQLETMSRAAHAFALAHLNNRTVGAQVRADLLAK
jgi:hypothetical protein